MKVLRNLVSGVEHTNIEDALYYYSGDLCFNNIKDLDELCEELNSLNLYDCGSSFEVVEV